MGGHGALICALKNPFLYKSVSAFAPVCNPTKGSWGTKVFTGYLGENEKEWAEWDATLLAQTYKGPILPILIDQVKKSQTSCRLEKCNERLNVNIHEGVFSHESKQFPFLCILV